MDSFYLTFTVYDWIITIVSLLIFITFILGKNNEEELNNIYIFLSSNIFNLFRWGINPDIIKLTKIFFEKFKFFTLIIFLLMIIMAYFNIISMIEPLFILFGFCIYILFSYHWILNKDNQRSNMFKNLKWIFIIISLIMMISLFNKIDLIYELLILENSYISEYNKYEIFLIFLIILLSVWITLFKKVKLFLWLLFGFFPTIILIFFFIKTTLKKINLMN
jgi:hypothetical protein